jgi:hypothetical protein
VVIASQPPWVAKQVAMAAAVDPARTGAWLQVPSWYQTVWAGSNASTSGAPWLRPGVLDDHLR